MRINFCRKRQLTVFFLIIFSMLLLIIQLFYIQVVEFQRFKKKADNQHKVQITLKPKRGSIYDRENRVLALDMPLESVFAVSREITDKSGTAQKLSEILHIDQALLEKRLNRNKAFVWIKRKISDHEARELKAASMTGIGMLKETKRSYPNQKLACQVVGFTDIDNNGLEGIELAFDSSLKGRYGWKSAYRDAKRKIISSYEEHVPETPGYNVVLNIDQVIQDFVEREMAAMVSEKSPKGAMIIAMNPSSGEIIAMASYPNFNPNSPAKDPVTGAETQDEAYKNKCITDVFEPGSVFKSITASAIIEEKAASPTDTFFCENGEYAIHKRILHDVHPYGTLSFREVIEKSSNIGTVKAAARLGKDKLFDYIRKFGVGAKLGIDLAGEEEGIIRPKQKWTPSDMSTVPMGQGISVTALQLTASMAAIANGGLLMRPYVVKCITDDEDNIIKEFKPEMIRRVISENTASTVRDILKGVVDKGTGTKAKLNGYTSGGKTGTAQKVDGTGRYASGKYMSSFVGFAPVAKPRIVLAVCIDEPKGAYYGGAVSAPVFKNILDNALKYMEVPEDDKTKK